MSVGTSQSKSQHRSLSIASGIFLIVLGFSTLFASVLPMSPRLLISAGLLSGGVVLVAPRRVRRLALFGASSIFLSIGVLIVVSPIVLGIRLGQIEMSKDLAYAILLWFVCLLAATGLLASGLWILAYMSGDLLLRAHPIGDLGRMEVIRQLFTLALGLQGPFMIVEKGEIRGDARMGVLRRLGGPGLLIVRPCQAVVLEWGGKITGIREPGVIRLKPFERVRHVILLEPKFIQVEFHDVLTKDGVTLSSVTGAVGYRFPPVDKSAFGSGEGIIRDDLYPTRRSDLERMLQIVPDPAKWDEAIAEVVERAARRAISRCTLEDLFPLEESGEESDGKIDAGIDSAALEMVSEIVFEEVRQRTRHWGVQITAMEITAMTLPEEIPDWVLSSWVADRNKVISVVQGEVDAKRAYAFESVRLAARRRAVEDFIAALALARETLDSQEVDRVARLMAWLMAHVAEDKSTGMRLVGALEQLMENPNAHIIIGSPDMGGAPAGQPPAVSDGSEE
ncbi:MAG: hypothetical protein GXP39_09145 [Chloroflexi bacterium]|nr:hypothetical protein [Chloroflexota bacterium]